MTDDSIFQLYGRVLKGDKSAAQQLTDLHRKGFPYHFCHAPAYVSFNRKQDLHMFYLHLTQ
jgi:hypothetical protein